MQTSYIWNKLDLRRYKIALAACFILVFSFDSFAQGLFGLTSSSGSDDKVISYGFFLAGHTNKYQLQYSDAFMDPANASNNRISSIQTEFAPGFSLGFVGMYRFHDQAHLLFMPKVGFYQYRTRVNFFSDVAVTLPSVLENTPGGISQTNSSLVLNEATMVELPILFKYRSQRFNNSRMYFIGGGSYQFRTKTQEEANLDLLVTSGRDFTIEMGMGFEAYFSFFKCSPEIRFSHGMNNLYQPGKTNPEIRDAISSIRNKSITVYLNFQ
jgi:hypothetical protein